MRGFNEHGRCLGEQCPQRPGALWVELDLRFLFLSGFWRKVFGVGASMRDVWTINSWRDR